MKKQSTKTYTRSSLIKMLVASGYTPASQFKEWADAQLLELAQDDGLVKSDATISQKVKKAAKQVKVAFQELVAGMTLTEVCKAFADGTITLSRWKDVGPVIDHQLDDMTIAPDLDVCWQPAGKLDEGKEIAKEVCKAILTLKNKTGIPKTAVELDESKVTKAPRSRLQGPYYVAGNFVYRHYHGNKKRVVASPVSVWRKYMGAKI